MTTDPRLPEHRSLIRRWFDWLLPRKGWVFALTFLWGVAGLLTFSSLRRDLFPDLALPAVQLLIQSPGRAASELELSVAQPVEQALSGLPGVKRLNTILQAGLVQVIIAFEADQDPWRSRQLVAEKLSTVLTDFPPGTQAPLMTSAAGRLQEIQEIVLEGPNVDPMKLRHQHLHRVVPQLHGVHVGSFQHDFLDLLKAPGGAGHEGRLGTWRKVVQYG